MSELAGGLSPSEHASPGRGSFSNRYFLIGWCTIALIFGGLLAWSVFAPFEGAVLATGQIAVESNQQAIQHLEGGIVREIYVREGDEVEEGQRLIALDSTSTDASVMSLEARLFELLGLEARLASERDATGEMKLRPGFEDIAGQPAMTSILAGQESLRIARQSSRKTQNEILQQRILQLSTRIGGMTREIDSKDTQISLLGDEIARFEELMARGNTTITRILALKRDSSRLQGEKEALVSDIAATRVQIGEARSEIVKLNQGYREEVLTELRDTQMQIGELTEQRTASLYRQNRLDIVAPRAGRIIGVRAHTVGGIVPPSEPIMYIVPENDRLVAKVRVMRADIDKISVGQKAILRFTAFNQNETPQVIGKIANVSADALADPVSGVLYYEAVIEIPESAAHSERFPLVPGMPVDAMLKTETRNVLSYLVKPLTDSISRTFRE